MKPCLFTAARLPFPLASAIAALLTAATASATPYDWTGATNGTWNTTTNWSGGSIPLVTDDLTILGPLNVAGVLNINFNANNSAKSLIFTNTAATTITNTTSGANRTLTLGSGGITTGAGAVQIGANVLNQAVNITLGTAQTWNVGAGGLIVTNSIGGVGTGITKTGAGNLTINSGAVNGFTGGVTVNAGTFTASYANFNGNQLISSSNALAIGGSGTFSLVGNNTAAAANIQTFANTTFNAGRNNIVIAKGASGASATLNLGALTVNPGSVTAFSATTAWTTTASTTERVFITAGGSVPSLPGSGSQFVNGVFYRTTAAAGAVRWAAVNSSGQLLAGTAVSNLVAGTGSTPTVPVQFQGAASLALTNTAVSTYGLLLNTTSNGLTLTLAADGTYMLNSIIQQQSANGVTIAAGTGASNLIIGSERNLVINMDNSAGLAINAPIANNGGGASSVTIASTAPTGTNPGNVSFGGANTYTGATYLMSGTLTLSNVNALQNTSGITLGSAGAVTLATSTDGITLTAPITTANTGVTSTISFSRNGSFGGALTLNGAIGGAGNLTFTTPNVNSGGQIQTIILGAAGNYAGTTTITTGQAANSLTVRAGVDDALPTSTVLNLSGGSGSGSGRTVTYDLFGNDQTLAGLTNTISTLTARNQRVTNSGALATLTINGSGDSTYGGLGISSTFNGNPVNPNAQITGAIALTKDGAGTFTLAAGSGNAFTGDTKILGGILILGHSTSIQNSAFDTTSSIAGNLTNGLRSSVTTLTLGGLTGGNDFSTRFTTTTGGYTSLTALTLNPGSGVTNSYAGDVGDGATGMNLNKTGGGTQTLTGTNTHTGTTTVSAGVLAVNGTLANTSTTTVSGTGTLKGSGSIASSVTINSGGTLASGTSIESLATGALSFTNASSFQYELDKDAAATVAGDLTAVTGNLSLTGTVTLNLLETGAGAWELGNPLGDHLFGSPAADKLTLISYSGIWNGGLFTYLGNLVQDDSSILLNGQRWWFNYNDTDAGTNFTGDLTGSSFVTMSVPEPDAAALLGGLGALALFRRRRN